MLKIHGVPFSAHTRKVIIAALEKGIPYEIVPVVPLAPPPSWHDLSPLGYIPAVEDDGYRLADSSVIGLYLERKHPNPSLYPTDAREYGAALWIEEFVDGGLQQHVLRGLLMQRVFAPKFLKKASDYPKLTRYLQRILTRDSFRRALEKELPAARAVGGLNLSLLKTLGY